MSQYTCPTTQLRWQQGLIRSPNSCSDGCSLMIKVPLKRVEIRLRCLLGAREEVDVVVTSCRATQYHAMGVECGSRNWCASTLLQEAGVWFHTRQFVAIEVENLDAVGRGTADTWLVREHQEPRRAWGFGYLHREHRQVLVGACRA